MNSYTTADTSYLRDVYPTAYSSITGTSTECAIAMIDNYVMRILIKRSTSAADTASPIREVHAVKAAVIATPKLKWHTRWTAPVTVRCRKTIYRSHVKYLDNVCKVQERFKHQGRGG